MYRDLEFVLDSKPTPPTLQDIKQLIETDGYELTAARKKLTQEYNEGRIRWIEETLIKVVEILNAQH